MPTADQSFKDLELFNVKIDVWIDEEDYKHVSKTLVPTDSRVVALIEKIFTEDNAEAGTSIGEEELTNLFTNLFVKLNNSPEKLIKIYENDEEFSLSKNDRNWAPLFFAKYVRSKILEKGTDKYIKHLEDLVIYLQRKLPHQFPRIYRRLIIQHLYFQELSACGESGIESLGFAVQALDLIAKKKGTGNRSHFDFELYKLWATLNKGIGFLHSEQKMNAASAFNEVIRKFEKKAKGLLTDEKDWWQSLLYNQAVLLRAELQEDLQFSYHTVITLRKLGERKREKRLIKEALAYRDMGRLMDARGKIIELLGIENVQTDVNKIKEIFKAFENWKVKKSGIRYDTLGLLFDFYLLDFEVNGEGEKKKQDIIFFRRKFEQYLCKVIEIKTERVRYYQQIARFLEWLLKRYDSKKEASYLLEQAKKLYQNTKQYLLPGKKSEGGDSFNNFRADLDEFDKYDYDRYSESMEKFYRLVSHESSEYEEDEKNFLEFLNKYEEKRYILFEFKRLERVQRIKRIKNGRSSPCHNECFKNKKGKEAFSGILKCAPAGNPYRDKPYLDPHLGPLIASDYVATMKRENDHFLDRLKYRSRHPIYLNSKRTYHFMGLQRWNSQTPTLTLSQGGGYLLYEQDDYGKVTLGIAIDPGFDFVDNLFHMGFTLNDIDFILLSHAHLDHIRDFEPIVSSLLDLKKREPGSQKKIHAMMTLGVYWHLEHVITNTTLREFLADTYIVDVDREMGEDEKAFMFERLPNGEALQFESIIPGKDGEKDKCVEIRPTRAYHDDYSERSDSFGYILTFYEDGNPLFSFGYTADTRWSKDIPGQYSDCDATCIHLGALIESKKKTFDDYDISGQECNELIERKWHPYLFGLLRFLKSINQNKRSKNTLILISEFGEEMKGGIRIDFIKRLNRLIESSVENDVHRVCLPVDIGLNVILARQHRKNLDRDTPREMEAYPVWCYGCDNFVDAAEIRYRHFGYGDDEAIFYFCDTCLKSKPENVIQDNMRTICEHGIPLRKAYYDYYKCSNTDLK